jgi:hypothetical protein
VVLGGVRLRAKKGLRIEERQAQILVEVEEWRDAMQYLDEISEIAWKCTPRMIEDAELETRLP